MIKSIETEKDLLKVRDMIKKECQKNSLTDLCESWNVDINCFYEFLNLALLGFDMDIDFKNNDIKITVIEEIKEVTLECNGEHIEDINIDYISFGE